MANLMNIDPKPSWRLKIGRAKEHFATLELEITGWVKSNPLAIVKEQDAEGRCHTVFAEVGKQPSLDRWSLIAGDCIHNLRSALDSVVYAIASHETGRNPPADEKELQFPIASSAGEFEKQRKRRLSSLSSSAQAQIEKVQPYNVPHPEFPPVLSLLGYFNNIDKHRTLNVMAAVPHHASIQIMHPLHGSPAGVTLYRAEVVNRTEILSFTMEPPERDLKYTCEMMIGICVAHPPGPSKSPFSELAGVLNALINEVERIVDLLNAVTGGIPRLANVSLSQAAHFDIEKDGAGLRIR